MTPAPGQPALSAAVHLRARWEWRWSPGAAPPYAEIEEFLVAHGLPAADLGHDGLARQDGGASGAALLLGGGWPVGAAGGPASPCPEVPDVAVVVYEPGPEAATPPARPAASVVGWAASWTAAEHTRAVEDVRAAIARGDLYQANVVGHREGTLIGEAAGVGAALARVPDAPYAGGVSGDGWAVHSASPELFLEVDRGQATTRPIKGTTQRSEESDADRRARDWLLASDKDRAEHVMIVDLERNDLGRVARTGAVEVAELYAVRPLAGLWHAESSVTARLRPGVGLAELLGATFPGGSVTGAPKLAALARIGAVEPVGRGPAMGAMGWFGADGRLTLGLTIRTVAVADGRVHLWTGGGVTWSSEAEAEVAEAEAKAAPLLAALSPDH
ncbi:MAG TPA: chorismate-binding protein [Mycobacteriales bacterium]|nr:chorismate-binding protein [Mycobacteriales bacterium]